MMAAKTLRLTKRIFRASSTEEVSSPESSSAAHAAGSPKAATRPSYPASGFSS